jgi:Putative enzyme of poly-gamma-glutamate biosynthesis (capsule formation)
VVIASAVVLVLIGIVSGVVTAAIASTPLASWNEGEPAEPNPGSVPSADPSSGGSSEGDTITLSGVGDVIMGSVNLGVPPNGGAGFFDGVRDALAADLVMGNLDQALSDPTGFQKCDQAATDCFQLSLPPSYAAVLRDGGFDLMSLANNHTYDMGQPGYANTRAALDAVGIAATGGVGEITYLTVKNIRVAVLGFSVYSYTANLNDIQGSADLVRQAAAQADLVVVQMQGGAEGSDRTHVPPAGQHEDFWGEDRGDLRGFAHAVIDAGADIVFGHGPHVMRGMEFYQGRLIAYSLGNFCGYAVLSSSGWSGVGGILKVTLTQDGSWVSGELIATELVDRGLPALDEERRALAFVDELSVADFGAAAARIDHTTGVITAP